MPEALLFSFLGLGIAAKLGEGLGEAEPRLAAPCPPAVGFKGAAWPSCCGGALQCRNHLCSIPTPLKLDQKRAAGICG